MEKGPSASGSQKTDKVCWDLVKTIDSDDENVPVYESSSESEVEFQPKKGKLKDVKEKEKIFSADFDFVGNVGDYNADPWKSDLQKYIKRKAKSKTDDKIAEVLQKKGNLQKSKFKITIVSNSLLTFPGSKSDDDDSDDDGGAEDEVDELSEDELKKDDIRVKETDRKRKLRKKSKGDEAKDGDLGMGQDFFDEADQPLLEPAASFHEMNLSRPLMKAMASMNFVHPTPIQSATIPVALLGRDICGCAATGTGKTAAFMLPVLERLLYRPKASAITRVLVLVPTRELGVQVYQVSKQLSQFTSIQIGLSVIHLLFSFYFSKLNPIVCKRRLVGWI